MSVASAKGIEKTDRQMRDLITMHTSYNYYNLIENNCSVVAVRAWNSVFPNDKFVASSFPWTLKDRINKKTGSYSVSLLRIFEVVR